VGIPFEIEMARARRDGLLRIARALRRGRRGGGEGRRGMPRELEGTEVGWGLAEEKRTIGEPLYRTSHR
jgi:hypothetical protein